MEEKVGTGRRAKKQELAAGVLHRELASFRDLLNEPISAERLNLWIATDKVRQSLTADTIWGTIQWPRSFGLPRTLILTSAFVIEHRLWQREATNAQVGPIKYDLLITDVSLQKWDGPHDAKYYRVSFMSHRMLGYKSEFLAYFAENTTWPSESRPAISLRRRLSPSAIKFDHPKDNKAITLPPFTVVNKRLFG